jgi:hypothetical protein
LKKRDQEFTIGILLQQVLRKHPVFSANPLGDWGELVGEQVARYSQPKSLKNKVLVVVAYDSVWKHHLELLKEDLIEKINKKFPEPLVEKITIKVGELPEANPVLNPNYNKLERVKSKRVRPFSRKKAPSRTLTPEEKKLVKSLPDPELRTLATRLLKRVPLEESPEGDPGDGE